MKTCHGVYLIKNCDVIAILYSKYGSYYFVDFGADCYMEIPLFGVPMFINNNTYLGEL